MKLSELRTLFRSNTADTVRPYLFPDEDIDLWLNEAENEAALRASLIHEASDASICSIAVAAALGTYPLHEAVFMVTAAYFTATGDDTDPVTLALSDRHEQDRVRKGWRTLSDEPTALIVEDTRMLLNCLPATAGVLAIECYRAPLKPMVQDNDTPEIGALHHRHLAAWAEHRAYSRPDTETFDANRGERAKAEFTRQFGERPDADMRRSVQANQPHSNKAWW
jgi:hypothetical protein